MLEDSGPLDFGIWDSESGDEGLIFSAGGNDSSPGSRGSALTVPGHLSSMRSCGAQGMHVLAERRSDPDSPKQASFAILNPQAAALLSLAYSSNVRDGHALVSRRKRCTLVPCCPAEPKQSCSSATDVVSSCRSIKRAGLTSHCSVALGPSPQRTGRALRQRRCPCIFDDFLCHGPARSASPAPEPQNATLACAAATINLELSD